MALTGKVKVDSRMTPMMWLLNFVRHCTRAWIPFIVSVSSILVGYLTIVVLLVVDYWSSILHDERVMVWGILSYVILPTLSASVGIIMSIYGVWRDSPKWGSRWTLIANAIVILAIILFSLAGYYDW